MVMPIYMDVHIVPGVKAKDVAEAHSKDLLHQVEQILSNLHRICVAV